MDGDKMKRCHYYAGYSSMGTNFTHTSPCWRAYRFDSRAERDAWVAEYAFSDVNRVAEPITRKVAYKIIGYHDSVYGHPVVWVEPDVRGPELLFRME